MSLSFRTVFSPLLSFVLIAAGGLDTRAQTQPVWRHGVSLMGAPSHGPDFTHFDYVNPNAPKGGEVRLANLGGFDNLNPFIARGEPASGLGLIYDSLMQDSLDEPSTNYGLIAEALSYPDDFSSVTFRLRPQARFHDGKPITPEDVIFSLRVLKEYNPLYSQYYANIVRAEKTGAREVTFYFDQSGNRELPQIVGQLPVLPEHYWQDRAFDKTTLEPPLGSGPYRIVKVDAPDTVIYERVADYWAKDLPVVRGFYNIDRIRYTSYQDTEGMFEAFKVGNLDFMFEGGPKRWVKSYTFDAVKKGWVIKEKYKSIAPERMQAFVLNTRRDKFADARVRRALNYAFNFEWSNENVSHGLNTRTASYFAESELASRGVPEGLELEILTAVAAKAPDDVPEAVFTTPYFNPGYTGSGAERKNLSHANRLLLEAGWRLDGARRVNAAGQQMQIEFLLVSPAFEPHVLAYEQNLEKLGIAVSIRKIDSAQYFRRLRSYDFDVVVYSWRQSLSPGNEQREMWGSAVVDRPGGRNMAGIDNRAVDLLIERIIFAGSREELVAATRALDRVLLWNHYVVPQWWREEFYVRWDKFSHAQRLPRMSFGFPAVWWYDREKAGRIGGN